MEVGLAAGEVVATISGDLFFALVSLCVMDGLVSECVSTGDLNFLLMLDLNEVDLADLKEELVETLAEAENKE